MTSLTMQSSCSRAQFAPKGVVPQRTRLNGRSRAAVVTKAAEEEPNPLSRPSGGAGRQPAIPQTDGVPVNYNYIPPASSRPAGGGSRLGSVDEASTTADLYGSASSRPSGGSRGGSVDYGANGLSMDVPPPYGSVDDVARPSGGAGRGFVSVTTPSSQSVDPVAGSRPAGGGSRGIDPQLDIGSGGNNGGNGLNGNGGGGSGGGDSGKGGQPLQVGSVAPWLFFWFGLMAGALYVNQEFIAKKPAPPPPAPVKSCCAGKTSAVASKSKK